MKLQRSTGPTVSFKFIYFELLFLHPWWSLSNRYCTDPCLFASFYPCLLSLSWHVEQQDSKLIELLPMNGMESRDSSKLLEQEVWCCSPRRRICISRRASLGSQHSATSAVVSVPSSVTARMYDGCLRGLGFFPEGGFSLRTTPVSDGVFSFTLLWESGGSGLKMPGLCIICFGVEHKEDLCPTNAMSLQASTGCMDSARILLRPCLVVWVPCLPLTATLWSTRECPVLVLFAKCEGPSESMGEERVWRDSGPLL